MKQKYVGTLAERRNQGVRAWRERFIARDPDGYKAYMARIQKRDRERYGEKRRAKARERYILRKRCHTLQQKYGITEAQFNALLAAQGGCGICRAAEAGGRFNRFHVDHDHSTGAVRGILCDSCNRGLGLFRERRENLEAAVAYLQTPPAVAILSAPTLRAALPGRSAKT